LYDQGLQYSTLGVYRSAISLYHKGFEGIKAGQHPAIISLFKGIFNTRPSSPRYKDTWDVQQVLSTLEAWGQSDELDLKQLTLKLTMLMALASASRASEIHLISIKNMVDSDNKIQFGLDGLTKVRRPGEMAQVICFETYPENPKLDVVHCIRAYMEKTKELRKSEQLLVTLKKPHKGASTSTISRWLKSCMEVAGIDTTTYKAHSIRGAATSKAAVVGMNTKQIMALANWKRASTFHKFYLRHITVQ